MPGPDQRYDVLRPAAVAGSARSLRDLARRLDLPAPASDAPVTGITHHSAAVRPGDVYAALPGSHVHGARFAADAVTAGAVAVFTDDAGREVARQAGAPVLVVRSAREALGPLASWIYGEPSTRLRMLGVTGTNGKTTTSYLLDAGLRAAGKPTGLIGTIETRIGDQVAASVRTTPEAPELQALLAVMVQRGVTSVSMEVSSHALALHRVDGTRYDVVAFTNLSQDHLDFHGDLDDYFAAKARLFTPQFARIGVVNVDDAHGRRLLKLASIPLVTVSTEGHDADWVAVDPTTGATGSRFAVRGPGVHIELNVRLPGEFNITNALMAFAILVTAGVEPDAAAAGIGGLPVVPGRMESISAGQPFMAFVDYAHTPEAVVMLLTTLRSTTAGRLIVALGCGGDRDRAKRPLMGAAAARLADVAVLTSDNPRSEEPGQILASMLAGAMTIPSGDRGQLVVEPDRAAAIAIAVNQARAGDVVVVAGKGHELGQEVGGVVHPFDDRAVLRAQLADVAGHWGGHPEVTP